MLIYSYLRCAHELVAVAIRHWQLLKALAKRDVSDEYLGQGFSTAWPIIQPLFLSLIYVYCFIFIFPTRVQAPTDFPTNAVTYLLAGIIPWLVLSGAISRSLTSVVNNSNIVKQISFPLELLPLKTLATPLFFGTISLSFLVCYSTWVTRGQVLLIYLWGIPLLIALSLPVIVGVALIVSTMQVFYRDLKEVVQMFLTAGLFIHPILYLPNAVPEAVRTVIYLSPFSYLLFCWQDILFFGGIVRPWAWAFTAVFGFIVFILGARLFVGSKPSFGDFL